MSDAIGPRNISQAGTQGQNAIGEDLQRLADKEVNRILSEQYERGMQLLTENKDVLDAIAKILIEEENINGMQLLKVIE